MLVLSFFHMMMFIWTRNQKLKEANGKDADELLQALEDSLAN